MGGITPAQATFWKGMVAGAVNSLIVNAIASQVGAANTFLFALAFGARSCGKRNTYYVTAAQRMGAIRSRMLFTVAPFFGLLLSGLFFG